MSNKKNRAASKRNGKANGITPSVIASQMLDDKFGGRKVSTKGRSSIKAIQKQVDELEKILKAEG